MFLQGSDIYIEVIQAVKVFDKLASSSNLIIPQLKNF